MGLIRWQQFRRVVTFLLGVAIIIDALWDKQYVVPELIIGMIMVGMMPLEDFAKLIRRNGRSMPKENS